MNQASNRLAGYSVNRGPFVARMRRLPGRRTVVLDLVPGFQFGLLTQAQTSECAKTMRAAVVNWFGWCKFDLAGLEPYVRCTADVRNRVVRVDFLPPSYVAQQGFLACNPEMLLALAETLDHRAGVLELAAP